VKWDEKSLKACVLITGDEVVLGKTKDTNGPYLAQSLHRLGYQVLGLFTIPDQRELLTQTLKRLHLECDLILMTGGLGPTSDDLTNEVVSFAMQIPLRYFPEVQTHVEIYFKALGRDCPKSNEKQSYLPEGSTLLPNPNGTAYGYLLTYFRDSGPGKIACLPGVPSEMRPMFLNFLLPLIDLKMPPKKLSVMQVTGLGESAIAQKIQDLESRFLSQAHLGNISYQAHLGYVTLTFEYEPEFEKSFVQWFEPQILKTLEPHVFSQQPESIDFQFLKIFEEKQLVPMLFSSILAPFSIWQNLLAPCQTLNANLLLSWQGSRQWLNYNRSFREDPSHHSLLKLYLEQNETIIRYTLYFEKSNRETNMTEEALRNSFSNSPAGLIWAYSENPHKGWVHEMDFKSISLTDIMIQRHWRRVQASLMIGLNG